MALHGKAERSIKGMNYKGSMMLIYSYVSHWTNIFIAKVYMYMYVYICICMYIYVYVCIYMEICILVI
jgi:hypothetical protein